MSTTDTTDLRVRRVLLGGAREAYVGTDDRSDGIPIDHRCPACGISRPSCASKTCIRAEEEA